MLKGMIKKEIFAKCSEMYVSGMLCFAVVRSRDSYVSLKLLGAKHCIRESSRLPGQVAKTVSYLLK